MSGYPLEEVLRKVRELGLCTESPPIQDVGRTLYLPSADIEAASKLLRSALEPTRLKILYLLNQAPLPTCVIACVLGQDRTLISHHLTKLIELGLVEVRRVRRFSIYNLTERGAALVGKILEFFRELTPPGAEALGT